MANNKAAQQLLKLTYFPIGGRALPIRWALSYSGIPFENVHVDYGQWLKIKPQSPFGCMPLLEINGVVYSQSNALLRYAGKLSGLYPTDPMEGI